MQTLEYLRRRVESAEDLQSIVRTMKALAAVGIRQYEQAAASLADYDRTVRLGLQAVLRDIATRGEEFEQTGGDSGSLLIVAFGSDQGMCGQLNDSVAERVEALLGAGPGDAQTLASGARLASMLRQSGCGLAAEFDTPGSIHGVGEAAHRILAAIEEVRATAGDVVVRLIHPRRTSAAAYDVRSRRVLPLDRRWVAGLRAEPWPTRRIPAWPGDRTDVLLALVGEYLFVSLYRALVDTLASEHASRLSSMQSAQRNIEERLEELQAQYRRQRQMSITSELMDIVSGFEALGEGAPE
ncbi:MAG: F0F1 ATP synthase subunit gamma [Phycisphaerales bacterium JB039]